jgi:hypothetical protein
MCGTNTVAWAVGAAAASSTLPTWPAYVFGAMTLAALNSAPVLHPYCRFARFLASGGVFEVLRRDSLERVRSGRATTMPERASVALNSRLGAPTPP